MSARATPQKPYLCLRRVRALALWRLRLDWPDSETRPAGWSHREFIWPAEVPLTNMSSQTALAARRAPALEWTAGARRTSCDGRLPVRRVGSERTCAVTSHRVRLAAVCLHCRDTVVYERWENRLAVPGSKRK